jgi:hypothetical protein
MSKAPLHHHLQHRLDMQRDRLRDRSVLKASPGGLQPPHPTSGACDDHYGCLHPPRSSYHYEIWSMVHFQNEPHTTHVATSLSGDRTHPDYQIHPTEKHYLLHLHLPRCGGP